MKISSNISIEEATKIAEDQINLLEKTIWGKPNQTQYIHTQTAEKLRSNKSWKHLSLRKNNKLLGTVTFVPHRYQKEEFNYIRYFSFASPIIGNVSKRKKNSVLKNEFLSILNRHNKNYFAYVELDNERSKNLCEEFGFTSVGEFETRVFSRFSPRVKIQLTRKNSDEIHNHQYNFFHQDNLKEENWILKRNNETVITAQVQKVDWDIISLPGVTGTLIKICSHLPNLKRLINKEKLRFITIEGLHIKNGYEYLLNDFLESLLAELNERVIIFWLDKKDPNLQRINQLNLGLLNKFNDGIGANIIYKGDLSLINKNLPFYISPYDMT